MYGCCLGDGCVAGVQEFELNVCSYVRGRWILDGEQDFRWIFLQQNAAVGLVNSDLAARARELDERKKQHRKTQEGKKPPTVHSCLGRHTDTKQKLTSFALSGSFVFGLGAPGV